MEQFFSLLFGIFGKLLDDIDDNNIIIDLYYKEILKSLNIVLFTLASKDDFLFSFSTFILSIFGAGVDTLYWKSFTYISLFLSILYFSSNINWPLFILIIIIIIYITHLEENAFPEEISYKKLITRISGFIFFLLLRYLPINSILSVFNYTVHINNIEYIHKLILIALGGIFVSIITQIYNLYIN
jgi:hypothetical protein